MKFPIPSYSQCGEDRLIWKLFGYQATGAYVDIGCHHPTNYSVTFLLYQAGWRGLAVDADDQYLPLYAQARPGDAVRNFAISKTPGMATLLLFEGVSMNTLDPAVAARYDAETPAKRAGTRNVEVRRMDQLLTEAGIERAYFLHSQCHYTSVYCRR